MSKLSKQILTIAIALLAFGCSKTKTPNETSFAISGTIQGADSPYIILREIGKTGFTPADTITLDKKGNFSHLVKMSEPTLYSLSYKDDYITLCPKVKEQIQIKSTAADFSGSYSISGSAESELLKQMNNHTSQIRQTLKAMSDYLKVNNIDNLDSVKHVFLQRLNEIHAQEVAYSEDFIHKHSGSLTTLIALYRTFEGRPLFDYRSDLSIYKEVLEGLNKTLPNNQHTLILKNFIEQKQQEQNEHLAQQEQK